MIQLQIETINVCNAACVFCPYPVMKRPKGTMSEDLFRKIIDEAVDIAPITELSFQGLGEPTLDPNIVERIRYAKKSKPAWITTMYTNGTRLETVGPKLEPAGLNILYVSVNASNPQGRHQVMRLNDYDKVVKEVGFLKDRSKFMKVIPKGVVNMDIFAGREVDAFRERWGVEGFLHMEGNWAGLMGPVRREKTGACNRALGQIMILWDGRVSLCCFDGEGEVIFGDLNHQSLREVYADPEYVRYREAHATGSRQGLKLCSTCTEI
jgi:MoaA/NifB/PqqE/SkfB family radical SAM enzyme